MRIVCRYFLQGVRRYISLYAKDCIFISLDVLYGIVHIFSLSGCPMSSNPNTYKQNYACIKDRRNISPAMNKVLVHSPHLI